MMRTPDYTDVHLAVEDRVEALLAARTLEEKVARIAGVWTRNLIDKNQGVPQVFFTPVQVQ